MSALRIGSSFAIQFAGVVLVSANAFAQQSGPGFYAGGAIGPNFAGSIVSLSGNTNIQTQAGPVGVLDLGYRFGNGFRVELEGDYRSNAAAAILTRRVNNSLLPMSNVSGSPTTYGFMANALYDLPAARLHLFFTPYIGGGIGYSRVDFGNVTGTEPFNFRVQNSSAVFEAPGLRTNGSASAFAYQAIAGASMPIPLIPGLEATVEYRYFATTRVVIPVSLRSTAPLPGNVISSGTNTMKVLARDSSVLFGVRYMFDKPGT